MLKREKASSWCMYQVFTTIGYKFESFKGRLKNAYHLEFIKWASS